MSFIPGSIIILLLLGLVYSCGNTDSVVNTGTLPTFDTAILVTDDNGRILGGDYGDWCINSGLDRSFGPAYPNPTNDAVTIQFSLSSADTISLYFLSGTDSTFLFRQNPLQAGAYSVSTSASVLHFANSYRRLYIANKRGLFPASTNCNNFGDIHFR